MYLTKIIALTAITLLGFAAVPGRAENATLKMTDGYFQVESRYPSHLIHQSSKPESIWLGENFRLWISLELEKTATSPCTRRSGGECTMVLRVESSRGTFFVAWKSEELRIDDTISFAVPGKILRDFDLGDATIRFLIMFREATIYKYDIPISVK